jgi:hypothetical protein
MAAEDVTLILLSQKSTFLIHVRANLAAARLSLCAATTNRPQGRVRARRAADPADGALPPRRIEPAAVLVDIKAWPDNVSVFGKVGGG